MGSEDGSTEHVRHFDVPEKVGDDGWEHIDFGMNVPWLLNPEKGPKEQLLKKSEEMSHAISNLEKIRSYLRNKAEKLDDK